MVVALLEGFDLGEVLQEKAACWIDDGVCDFGECVSDCSGLGCGEGLRGEFGQALLEGEVVASERF